MDKEKKKISSENKKLISLMLNKSQDSFILAIELYNKPTTSLNIDSFCIFICNAWELMLKAYRLSIGESIYFKRSSRNRSLDLSSLVRLVLTNEKDPVRLNLEIVIGIRNKATHLIIPEYASAFNDVFLATVKNYTSKLEQLFNIQINDKFKTDFLTIFIPSSSNNVSILKKYGKTIEKEYYDLNKYVNQLLYSSAKGELVPDSLAVSHEIMFKKVSNIADANLTIAKDNRSSTSSITIVEKLDPNTTHPYTNSKIIENVANQLKITGLTFTPYVKSGVARFTRDTLNLYIKAFNIKSNSNYCYEHKLGKNTSFTYSAKLIEKIIEDITYDPDIFVNIKNKKEGQ